MVAKWLVVALGFHKDNLFIFTLNPDLLSIPTSELRLRTDLKFKYIHVDGKHKCVPSDYYLGYDTFMVYTFYSLG